MNKYKDGENKNHGNKALFAVIITLVITLCLAGGALAALVFFMPSFKVDPYYKYIERGAADEYALVYGAEAAPEQYYALSFEDDILLDTSFITDYEIDPYLFWDENEQVLTISTPLEIFRLKPDEAFYTLNGERKTYPIENTALYVENGKVFLPLSFAVEHYPIDAAVSDEMKTVIVDGRGYEKTRGIVKTPGAAIRYEPDIKSDIAVKAAKSSTVHIFGDHSDAGFYYVRAENGAFGYIKEKDVQNIEIIAAEPPKDVMPPPQKYAGKPFALVWDQISGEGETDWVSEKIEGLSVVSPTWLELLDGDGNISDTGAKAYADKAKSAGYALWPLFNNGFNSTITHDALSSTAKRQKLIDALLVILDKYGAEGLNVDFEAYKIEDGYYYTQFLRELCVALRLNGYISSVDLPVPTLRNSPTNREQIGVYADYIIVMAYDQHWASSPVKGPVAGHDWVLEGIVNTLEYVPPEKVVLGLPLYTRIWYEPKDTDEITSRDFAMRRAYELFELREADIVWEENTGYERGTYEFEIDGVLNTITSWLESTDSLRLKAEIIEEFGLAGAACWKKGLETEEFWGMLSETLR